MKLKTRLFLLVLSLGLFSSSLSLFAQTSPTILLQGSFRVPGPDKQELGKPVHGYNSSFTVSQKSTVTLNLSTNLPKPTLNVYVMTADNYGKYLVTGSLTGLNLVSDLSKMGTVTFKTGGVLNPGKYGVVIQWSQMDLYDTEPLVSLEVDAQKYVDPHPNPRSETIRSCWLHRGDRNDHSILGSNL